jgi:hypothetical protein
MQVKSLLIKSLRVDRRLSQTDSEREACDFWERVINETNMEVDHAERPSGTDRRRDTAAA